MIFIKIFINYILFQAVTAVPLYTLSIFNNNLLLYYLLAVLFFVFQFIYIFFTNRYYSLKLFHLEGTLKCIKTAIYGMIIIFINQLVFIFLSNQKIINNSSSRTFESLFAGHDICLYLYLLIMAPILEEIFFRGVFYKILIPVDNEFKQMEKVINIKILFIVIVNAALFSYAHSYKIGLSSLCYFIGGIVLSVCYLKSNNLKVPILIHSFNNIVSCII